MSSISNKDYDLPLLDNENANNEAKSILNKNRCISLFRIIFSWIFLCLIVLIIGAFTLIQLSDYFISDLPDPKKLADPRESTTIMIRSNDGQDIGTRGSYYGGEVTLDKISPNMINAVIALEDKNFFTHTGFDPVGIIRAFIKNTQSRRVVQGASTITQQLAKDIFVGSQRSYTRKIKELLYAIKIEMTYSKKRILELYLNRVYLGAGIYGIGAAADRYFGTTPQELTIAQSALIAGLLKAPSRYSPVHNPEKAKARSKVAIEAMFKDGYITKQERDDAILFPAKIRESNLGDGFGYIADRIANLVPNLLGFVPKDVIVTTTINTNLQSIADTMTYNYVNDIGEDKGFTQAAFVAMDDNGAILAMTGGNSYKKTAFNRTTHALRQPGSAFKPFIYATAFENGYTPNSILIDEDISFGNYRPKNYKKEYQGAVSLKTAFAKSINTVSVKLAHSSGIYNVKRSAQKSGIISPMKPYLSMALGAFEVTPLELTASYIPFFNGGMTISPHLITKIENKDGDTLFSKNNFEQEKLYSDKTLYAMKDIFNAVTSYGTGRKAKLDNIPTYGKTGTTSGYKDAWFIGHAGNYDGITAAIWIGNDDYKNTNEATGGSVAAPLWNNIMKNYFSVAPREYEEGLGMQKPIIKKIDDPIGNILENINSKTKSNTMAPIEDMQDKYNEDRIENILRGLI